jgi:hypothetical protein
MRTPELPELTITEEDVYKNPALKEPYWNQRVPYLLAKIPILVQPNFETGNNRTLVYQEGKIIHGSIGLVAGKGCEVRTYFEGTEKSKDETPYHAIEDLGEAEQFLKNLVDRKQYLDTHPKA